MFHRYRLDNGIEIISEPMENRRTVSIGAFVKVGSSHETREENGICHLIEHMLFKGTHKHTAKEIADITVRMGDDVNAFTSKECTALYGMTITENLPEMIALLGDMLSGTKMDAKELAKEKRVVMDEIDMYADSPEDLVHELLQKRVWREDALGFLISGTKTTVRSFDKEQLLAFQKQNYYGENMLISVAGGYEEKEMLACLAKSFGRIRPKPFSPQLAAQALKAEKKSELALEPYFAVYPEERSQNNKLHSERATGTITAPEYFCSFVTEHKDIEQLHMNLAFPGLVLGDERRFMYSIFNSVFGGSNNSRLFQRIREEEGLAYSVYSYSSAYQKAGLFHIDITVQPGLAEQVLRETIEIIREFTEHGLTPEELTMHKQQVKTELIMNAESPKTRMDSNAKFALADARLYTLEEKLERIEAVTCEEIRQLAKECLNLSCCSICVVGNRENGNWNALRRIWKELTAQAV
ncbi:MAG: insulinase family protein [Lachnospiraceae bacterium]|nr:insulinase family protein [Lachnospiraceae bacterium]